MTATLRTERAVPDDAAAIGRLEVGDSTRRTLDAAGGGRRRAAGDAEGAAAPALMHLLRRHTSQPKSLS